MPPLATGIEVIAASKSWEVSKFQMFQKEFLKKFLNPEDASIVLAHASHYDLEEICELVKSKFSVKLTSDYKKRQKSCFVSISTYIEPLEIYIPFLPTGKDFKISFDRPISNKFTFKAYSHRCIIIGFRVELNEEHLSGNSDKCLEIDYSVRNVSKNQEAYNGTESKPLRPINVINFKENLILNPHEVGEITVDTELKPYLCSENKEETIKRAGEFALTYRSSLKSGSSDLKLFFVRGLLYHKM